LLIVSCTQNTSQSTTNLTDTVAAKKEIAAMLDSFNLAAANADFDRYFNYYTSDAVFLGTDATEYWGLPAFKAYAKPHFDKKKAWNFTSVDRHIYFGKYNDIAWFDELLSTQMKICRGSGVVVNENGSWKLKQYVLSTTVPNSLVDSVTKMKAAAEDSLMQTLR
jgi:ketosteroid isomerase-like protein